jgi:hypothetical protein
MPEQPPLEDLSPMPFGVHQGKPMQDVPTTYLHWLWGQPIGSHPGAMAVRDYTTRHLSALKKENDDLIWN